MVHYYKHFVLSNHFSILYPSKSGVLNPIRSFTNIDNHTKTCRNCKVIIALTISCSSNKALYSASSRDYLEIIS